jgi:SulP family sulfate permease
VLFLTVFADLIIAVGAGFVLACILFVRRLGESNLSEHGRLADRKEFDAVAAKLPDDVRRSVYIYSFKGPFFFGEVENFRDAMDRLSDVRFVMLCFDGAPVVDQTGAYALEETLEQLEKRGLTVLAVELQPLARRTLERLGVLPRLCRGGCFDRLDQAVDRAGELAAADAR